MGLANSLALKIAGISNYTNHLPDGGAIIKNNDGGNFTHHLYLSNAFYFQCIYFLLIEELHFCHPKVGRTKSVNDL